MKGFSTASVIVNYTDVISFMKCHVVEKVNTSNTHHSKSIKEALKMFEFTLNVGVLVNFDNSIIDI